MSNARLGKGLSSIFGSDVTQMLDDIQNGQVETEKQEQTKIPVDSIRPNPYQPRKVFSQQGLEDLAASIEMHGVFTPILVKRSIQGYELIAGERRLRASKMAGLHEIPAIIVNFDDKQMMEISLLENIQREDLNVIEEAKAYEQMIKKLSYTQEQTALRVGKSREHVTNLLRLLKLPEDVQQLVVDKKLSMGHVRALLSLKDEDAMKSLAAKAIEEGWSVRKMEQAVKEAIDKRNRHLQAQEAARAASQIQQQASDEYADNDELIQGQNLLSTVTQPDSESIYIREARHQLEDFFQTTVKIRPNAISIRYENDDDLNRILEKLSLIEKD